MAHNLMEKNSFDVQDAVENVEATVATPGSAIVAKAIQIAGSDGTKARIAKTDEDGHLQIDVLSGGGTVGGALELTQTSVKTAVELLDDTVATDGSAKVTNALQVAGEDGTNAQIVKTDSDGHLQVDVLSGANNSSIGSTGAAVPASATYIGGYDATGKLSGLLVDGDKHLQVDVLSGGGTVGGALDTTVQSTNTKLDAIEEITIERYLEIERFVATTGFAGTTADVAGIATTTTHVPHEDKLLSITFDKSGATVTEGGIAKTLSSAVNASDFEATSLICYNIYLSSIANVSYTFIRIGTSASHYTEYRASVNNLTAATFNRIVHQNHQFTSQTGNGCNLSAITYIAIGVVMGAAANTLAGIIVDYANLASIPNVAADMNLTVISDVSAASVRVQKFGPASSGNVPTGAGAVTTGTQRITLASDDPAVATLGAVADAGVTTDVNGSLSAKLRGLVVIDGAIKTAVEIMDDWDSSDHCKTYPHPEFTDSTTILNAVTADNGAPAGVVGIAFQSDTKDAYIEVYAVDEEAGVSNVDINIYVYQPDSAIWRIPSGGALVDLQLETNNRWGVIIPNARLIGTRVYVEVDNYVAGATTIKVSAKMTEVTY